MVEKVLIMGLQDATFTISTFTSGTIPVTTWSLSPLRRSRYRGPSLSSELSGNLYPEGIAIHHESQLSELIRQHQIDLVALSYSDLPHVEVMHKASLVMAGGADFILIGATYTMLRSKKPVVSVCAVRTGCGKSQTTRKVCRILGDLQKKVVVVRHPMPYGDLRKQMVQRFSSYGDFHKHQCTIEEREEYEPLVDQGVVVYAGVDYSRILEAAEEEAEVIVWDGGNNDTPFYFPDVHLVLFDPHRPGHELLYYPGETNMLMADIAIINKVDTASPETWNSFEETLSASRPERMSSLRNLRLSLRLPLGFGARVCSW